MTPALCYRGSVRALLVRVHLRSVSRFGERRVIRVGYTRGARDMRRLGDVSYATRYTPR